MAVQTSPVSQPSFVKCIIPNNLKNAVDTRLLQKNHVEREREAKAMNHKASSVNKSENPRCRSTSLRIVALAATFAVLFWSFQTNAYPLHNGEYAFWPEMPEAAQVLADMKGTNDFDTAVHQHAALALLRAPKQRLAGKVSSSGLTAPSARSIITTTWLATCWRQTLPGSNRVCDPFHFSCRNSDPPSSKIPTDFWHRR